VYTPQLLAQSGIGPPDVLRAAGLPVHHERPGVGRGYSDHPAVYLAFTDTTGGELHPQAPGAQAAVHLDSGDDPAGDLEILLFARPFAAGGPSHLMAALQAPESRGVLTPSPEPGGTPRLEHRYLVSGRDRARMRQVVRRAGELLAAAGLALDGGRDLDHRELDAWIAAHLTTSAHLCGTARLGPTGDPDAVVDPELRVQGLHGLRVVDTSVLPAVPRRGPAATALMLGERGADLVAGRRTATGGT
jgi:choline dehydrogenase